MQASPLSVTTLTPPNRRTSPRLDVLDQLHGQVVSFNLPITVLDLSTDGFASESVVPFPVGATHLFRFTTAAGIQVQLEATARHRRPTPSDDGRMHYVTGFAFVQDASHDMAREIGFLLDAMTADLQFEELAC